MQFTWTSTEVITGTRARKDARPSVLEILGIFWEWLKRARTKIYSSLYDQSPQLWHITQQEGHDQTKYAPFSPTKPERKMSQNYKPWIQVWNKVYGSFGTSNWFDLICKDYMKKWLQDLGRFIAALPVSSSIDTKQQILTVINFHLKKTNKG